MKPDVLTVSQADELLAQLDSREAQLSVLLATVGTRLAESEAKCGEAYLDGDETPLREVAELRLRVDGINAALEALSRRRALATLARRRAEALELRRQAAENKTELSELERKTSRLLGELSKLEGIAFTSSILSSQPLGAWILPGCYTPNDKPYLGARELFADREAIYGVPRSRALRSDIAELEKQAALIEQELTDGAAE